MSTTLTRTTGTVRVPIVADERSVIEALKADIAARRAAQPPEPGLGQVLAVVRDLVDGAPLERTARKMARTDQQEAERMVLGIVATFGTWLSHSIGRADVSFVYAVDDLQPTLFAEQGESDVIVIPVGYEPTGPHRRDVDKALCTIVHYRPDDEVVARFVARTYAVRQSNLGYPVIAGVWGFAQRGRLATMHKVSDDLVFQSQIVEAFEILDVARQDAVDAICDLRRCSAGDARRIVKGCDRAYWIDESFLGSLRKHAEVLLATTDSSGDTSERTAQAAERLRRQLVQLDRRCVAAPDRYMPERVGDLTLGQVRRICAISGIKVDPENRSEETAIRATLKSMGFAGDADRLIPEALRCAENGLLDNFWAIMQARLEGDASWSSQLRELARA